MSDYINNWNLRVPAINNQNLVNEDLLDNFDALQSSSLLVSNSLEGCLSPAGVGQTPVNGQQVSSADAIAEVGEDRPLSPRSALSTPEISRSPGVPGGHQQASHPAYNNNECNNFEQFDDTEQGNADQELDLATLLDVQPRPADILAMEENVNTEMENIYALLKSHIDPMANQTQNQSQANEQLIGVNQDTSSHQTADGAEIVCLGQFLGTPQVSKVNVVVQHNAANEELQQSENNGFERTTKRAQPMRNCFIEIERCQAIPQVLHVPQVPPVPQPVNGNIAVMDNYVEPDRLPINSANSTSPNRTCRQRSPSTVSSNGSGGFDERAADSAGPSRTKRGRRPINDHITLEEPRKYERRDDNTKSDPRYIATREANNEAVRRSRKKKKLEQENLENEMRVLRERNRELETQLQVRLTEIGMLREQINALQTENQRLSKH